MMFNRRKFVATAVAVSGALATKAAGQQPGIKVDGGLARLEKKVRPERAERLVPPGASSVKDFYDKCTACQLCVAHCPGNVLSPSSDVEHFLQPRMDYVNGWCRPECTACSTVCPTGAIKPLAREQKTLIRIGTARINPALCLAANGKESCGNCVEHCPSGALMMVKDEKSGKPRPVVSEQQCTGCGACEFLCPVRPLSAITVDGLSTHQSK